MANPDSVQEVRDRIIQLAREIEQFSQSNIPAETFFQEFLKRVVGAVGARAGAVWMRNGSNQMNLVCDQGLRQTGFHDSPDAPMRNQKLLTDVMSNGQACTYSPDDANVDLPTGDLIVLAALQRNKECVGAVEIFQRADTPMQARPGFLQFVEQMCGYACRYLDQQSVADDGPAVASNVPDKFALFLLKLHGSLDIDEIAGTAANLGQPLLGCDRLSIVVQKGRKATVKAISEQDSVSRRSDLVRLMAAMSSKIIAMREPLTYTGKLDHLPPQIEVPLSQYVGESESKMVMVVPLFETAPLIDPNEKENEERRREKKRIPIGGLVVEQATESQPQPGLTEKVEMLADHVATSMSNARRHHGLFLMPLWRFLGRCFSWLEGRTMLKVAGVFLIVAAIIVGMVFVPYEYRVDGEGHLMPVIQRDVFAPWDGEVAEIFVDSKGHVKKDDKLLKLENAELRAQLSAAETQLEGKRQLLVALHAELDEAIKTAQRDDEIRLQGKIVQTQIERTGAKEHRDVLKAREAQLLVLAPIDGVVATFQLDQLLLGRPVRKGELLLEIRDDAGPWHLELEVEEKRMGHLMQAQADAGTQELPVEFVLSTDPDKLFQGKLSDMSTRADASQLAGSIIRVNVSTDAVDLPERNIGADVRAKISCGQKSLGYVLLGDVVEFLQRYFWL